MKTKIFLILMAFVLGITQVHVSSATEIGDINNDTKVTSVDALIALQIAVGIIPHDIAADVNCDGNVTSLDALMILQKSVGLRELRVLGDSDGDGNVTSEDAMRCIPYTLYIQYNPIGDVSCDGEVTSVDALMILQKSVGLIELKSCC